MAYASSPVANVSDLLTFIRNTCTANGWTLSGNVLWKGSTYVEVLADGTVGIRITGGTGKDGSNNLTGACPTPAYLGTIAGQALTYPLTVEVHINTSPDEVFVVISYATSFYSLMAWGISDVPGISGSGVWFYANRTYGQGSREYHTGLNGIDLDLSFGSHIDGTAMFMVATASNGGGTNNSFIHADVDGGGWHAPGVGVFPCSFTAIYPLTAYLPNLWNGETVLLPYPVYMARPSSKNTLVADFKHIRHVRIDNHEPGDIITLGSDKWKFYPWFRKDASVRNGGFPLTHSGTIGYALRYTGP